MTLTLNPKRVQELGNSLADLRRQLSEASEERATLLTVQRQTAADMGRAQSEADAACADAAASGRALAQASTQLKVALQPSLATCAHWVQRSGCSLGLRCHAITVRAPPAWCLIMRMLSPASSTGDGRCELASHTSTCRQNMYRGARLPRLPRSWRSQ